MTIKSDVLAAQDHISKAIISALEKKRSATASKLFQVYEELGTLAKQFPEYSEYDAYSEWTSQEDDLLIGPEFHVNAAEPVDYYNYGIGMGEDHISFSSDTISLG
ncbi:hypothetical protein SBM3_00092 [Synechococcus phage S-BM3]|nr:hypothetical protein SBM3_00092 [Synechococcus phage S-BM3]